MANIHLKNKVQLQPKLLLWSTQDDVATPKDLYKSLDDEFKFNFDSAPFMGKGGKFDGLKIENWGTSTYCNPPYSEIHLWLEKAVKEMKKGNNSVFLIPLRMATNYWAKWVFPYASEIRPIAGYIKFQGYEDIRGLNTPIGLVIYNRDQYNNKFRGENNIHFSKLGDKEVICLEW